MQILLPGLLIIELLELRREPLHFVCLPLAGGGFFLFHPCLVGALPGETFLVGGLPQPVSLSDLLYTLLAELLRFRPQTLGGRVISCALPHLVVNRRTSQKQAPTLVK